MKNLAVITINELRNIAPTLPISTVKSLIKACADVTNNLKADKGTKEAKLVKEAILVDMLRKESLLTGELVRRGFHTQKDSADLIKWRNEGMGHSFK